MRSAQILAKWLVVATACTASMLALCLLLAACKTLGKPGQSRTLLHTRAVLRGRKTSARTCRAVDWPTNNLRRNQQSESKKLALSLRSSFTHVSAIALRFERFHYDRTKTLESHKSLSLSRTHKQRGVRAEAKRAPRPLAPAERRVIDGAARAQRLQDAGGAARDPILGRPTTHDHEPLANHSSAVVS